MILDLSILRRAGIQALACAILLSACAAPERDQAAARPDNTVTNLLTEADTKLTAADYAGAITSYTAFVSAHPDHPHAARARATQKALEKLIAAQVAMQRTQQGTDATRRELSEKIAESERLRGEIAKLRADLERLRSIDLPGRAK